MSVTAEQAAAWFAERAKNTPMPGAKAMFEIAATALREKAEREDPKPLTLEELWELKAGDVIWHQSLQGLSSCFVVLRHHDIEIFKSELTAARYGKTWFAYRHKPKEVTA